MHRPFWQRLLIDIAVLALIGGVLMMLALQMIEVHNQDVSIYSILPDGRLQRVGLQHKTYILHYWNGSVILFGTTINTGVMTCAREDAHSGERR